MVVEKRKKKKKKDICLEIDFILNNNDNQDFNLRNYKWDALWFSRLWGAKSTHKRKLFDWLVVTFVYALHRYNIFIADKFYCDKIFLIRFTFLKYLQVFIESYLHYNKKSKTSRKFKILLNSDRIISLFKKKILR